MVNSYCEALYRAIEEQLVATQKCILAGQPQTFEHFKYLLGRAEGLEIALTTAKQVYKKMFETKELENKEANHDERRVTREFY